MICRKRNNERCSSTGRKAGFTLIELLVVIAIISLLVSILLPSLQKARELAKQITCASTQRQIAMSCLLYFEDYNPYLPRTVYYPPTGDPILWSSAIGPYFGDHVSWPQARPSNEELQQAGFFCPSATFYGWSSAGYGMNNYIPEMNGYNSTHDYWPKLEAIPQTSMMPFIADSLDWHLGEPWQIQFYADPTFNHPFNVERHMEGESFNAVFADAHVESIPSERFTGGSNPENEAEVLKFFRGE